MLDSNVISRAGLELISFSWKPWNEEDSFHVLWELVCQACIRPLILVSISLSSRALHYVATWKVNEAQPHKLHSIRRSFQCSRVTIRLSSQLQYHEDVPKLLCSTGRQGRREFLSQPPRESAGSRILESNARNNVAGIYGQRCQVSKRALRRPWQSVMGPATFESRLHRLGSKHIVS